jgi:hypothetical protein
MIHQGGYNWGSLDFGQTIGNPVKQSVILT